MCLRYIKRSTAFGTVRNITFFPIQFGGRSAIFAGEDQRIGSVSVLHHQVIIPRTVFIIIPRLIGFPVDLIRFVVIHVVMIHTAEEQRGKQGGRSIARLIITRTRPRHRIIIV